MNGRDEHDEVLEAMLNADKPYVDDAGFTACVMERLPPRRRSVARLRVAIILSASGVAALLLLLNRPLSVELGRAFSRVFSPRSMSLSTLPFASMVIVAMLLWAGLFAVERE